jgi:hypothetical protein
VLTPFTNDFLEGKFEVAFKVTENVKTGALRLYYEIDLDEPLIHELVRSRKAIAGCIVVCQDTYYNKLHELSFETGFIDFLAGKLINKVTLRPIIWVIDEKIELSSISIHKEFGEKSTLIKGDIIAFDDLSKINIGKAKLAPMESIFELTIHSEIEEGTIGVNLDAERIAILLGPKTFTSINILRGSDKYQSLLMSSVYLPAVMEVLDQLKSKDIDFTHRRWNKPFRAKCDLKGVEINESTSLLEAAQLLLESPISKLKASLIEGDSDE